VLADEPLAAHVLYSTTPDSTRRKVLINTGQQISREEALSLLHDPKRDWFLRGGDQIGSIEEGKLAEILDRAQSGD